MFRHHFRLGKRSKKHLKMKIPTLSVFAIFALLGMALGMGSYGYGSYGYGAHYVPVPIHPGGSGGIGDGGLLTLLGFLFLIMLLYMNTSTTTGTTVTAIG